MAHVNEQLNASSFAWIDHSQFELPAKATPVDVAWGTLRTVAPSLKLSTASVEKAHVAQIHDLGRGPIIARFAQTIDGVDVFRSRLNVTMQRDLTPVGVTGSLAPSIVPLASSWTLDAPSAVAAAYTAMSGNRVSATGFSANGTDAAGHARYLFNVQSTDQLSYVKSRVKKVWYPQAKGLAPAYYVEVKISDAKSTSSSLNSFVIDATSGAKLFQHNMVASDTTYRVWADSTGPKAYSPQDSPYGNDVTPNPNDAYVATQPEPQFILQSSVKINSLAKNGDPWLAPGAAELSGNNARAYADRAPPDGYSAGTADLLVTPTATDTFDRIWDPKTLSYATNDNIMAITTNLFFIVNYMHDLFYDSGYDEKSGAAQVTNYGRGGVEGDPILAEAQDYSGTDNANCQTPSDGESPVIQMYLWDFASPSTMDINAPSTVAKTAVPTGTSAFGPQVYSAFTGNVVTWVDGSGGTNYGCVAADAATNTAVNGNICLVDQGGPTGCNSTAKAQNCLKAGAIGLIFVSADETTPPLGTSTDALNAFPAQSLPHTLGTTLKGTAGVNVTMHHNSSRDGSVDGTIVSHEWGHSLSHRLIDDANGLNSNQSNGMGEGWSDFVSLLTYIRPTDTAVKGNSDWSGAYPMGSYALGGSPLYLYSGIRRYPYSRDKTINPLTFTDIQQSATLPTTPPADTDIAGTDNSEVHATGEVWTTMLWDCYTGLLRDTANYTFDTASQAMRDYLVASLKLTPTDPTFTEARDAWLMAALANTAKPGDFMTFATAFAGRGIGTGAVSPPRYAGDNNGVTESFVAGADLALTAATLDDDTSSCDNDHVLDNGETGTLTVTIANTGVTALAAATAKVSSTNAHVTFPQGASFTFPATALFASSSVKIPVALSGAGSFEALDIQIDLDAPGIVANTPAGNRSTATTFRGNFDWTPASSATDSNDAPTTLWTASNDKTVANAVDDNFTRVPSSDFGFGQVWYAVDATDGTADQRLTSPALTVGSGAFSFTFKHHYSLEFDAKGNYYDGGVIELSSDGGATWTDIGASAVPGYTQTLFNDPSDPEALAGRMAFAGTSAGYPADIATTVSLGTTYAGKTVQIRFRLGSDFGNSAGAWTGWYIDDIAFTGIVGTPFASPGAQVKTCGAQTGGDMGTSDGGTSGGGKHHSGCSTTGSNAPATALPLMGLLLLGLALRRRTRNS